MDDNLMDDNLNVGNLLETRAGRAPTTQDVEALVRSAGPRYRSSAPIAALTLAAVAVAFTIVLISKRAGKRVHVMEKY